jgi:hypothetical protein
MDALVTVNVFLFEAFRFDRRAGGLFRRDEGGVFAPVAIGPRALAVLGISSRAKAIWSRRKRSCKPSGRERWSKTTT